VRLGLHTSACQLYGMMNQRSELSDPRILIVVRGRQPDAQTQNTMKPHVPTSQQSLLAYKTSSRVLATFFFLLICYPNTDSH